MSWKAGRKTRSSTEGSSSRATGFMREQRSSTLRFGAALGAQGRLFRERSFAVLDLHATERRRWASHPARFAPESRLWSHFRVQPSGKRHADQPIERHRHTGRIKLRLKYRYPPGTGDWTPRLRRAVRAWAIPRSGSWRSPTHSRFWRTRPGRPARLVRRPPNASFHASWKLNSIAGTWDQAVEYHRAAHPRQLPTPQSGECASTCSASLVRLFVGRYSSATRATFLDRSAS